jgi:large subunit ribosomal protein L24
MKVFSKSPRKQRNFVRLLALHLRKNLCICHLGKELKKETGKRSLTVRSGDRVRVMRGSQKKKEGKVMRVDYSRGFVFIEKLVRKKADGKEKMLPIRASNAMIIGLDRNDERRFGKQVKETLKAEKESKAVAKKEDIWEEKTEKVKENVK